MKRSGEIGLKIDRKTREYYRYTGVSSETEKRGLGASHTKRFSGLAIQQEREIDVDSSYVVATESDELNAQQAIEDIRAMRKRVKPISVAQILADRKEGQK